MSTENEITTFLVKYTPEIAAQLLSARAKLQALFPQGFELVYDNYNALVFCFGPTDRASDALLSVAGYPKWITLFFAKGKTMKDPTGILQGSGNIVRSIRLGSPEELDKPEVQSLITQAIQSQLTALELAQPLRTVIKSVSKKQRPRRPPSPSQEGTDILVKRTRK